MTSQIRLGLNAILQKTLTPSSEFFRHEALKNEKTSALVEKGNALRVLKIYRNLSLLISFFEIL